MKFDFTEKDMQGGGTYLPEGEHEVTVKSVKDATSKAGAAMVVIEFADRLGRTANEYITASAAWKAWNLGVACGIDPATMKDGLDTDRLRGRKVLLVKKQTGVTMIDNKERKDYSQEYYSTREDKALENQPEGDLGAIPF